MRRIYQSVASSSSFLGGGVKFGSFVNRDQAVHKLDIGAFDRDRFAHSLGSSRVIVVVGRVLADGL